MLFNLVKILDHAKRFFDKSGMLYCRIHRIDFPANDKLRMTLSEVFPDGKTGTPFCLDFYMEGDSLQIENPNTGKSIYDHAEEYGWNKETVHYIQYGRYT